MGVISGGGSGSATTDASALTTGTLPLGRLSGITTTQLDAAAGITSAQIAALDAAKITSGTLPLARLSGLTTSQLDAAAGITSGQIASLAASKLTGANTLPDGVLSTNVPLLNAANTFSSGPQIVNPSVLATANYGSLSIGGGAWDGSSAGHFVGSASGTRLAINAASGATGNLADWQVAGVSKYSVDVSGNLTLAGTLAATSLSGTLADARLSANVPLLASANTFTAAQTISATVAGVLAQINNASTTGGGIVVGSTTVASAGAGKIAPALALTQTTPATANYGLFSVGGGPWDGSTTGKFASSSNGCLIAGNAASGFSGNLLDLQLAGTSRIKIDQNGAIVVGSVGSLRCPSYSPSTFQAAMAIGDGGAIAVSGQDTHTPNAAGNVPLICKGVASQTGDLFQVQNSAAAVQFGIMNGGSGGSPVWALRVRATANAESMAVSHTAGAATGKCIQVFDDAGTSLGYLALYA